MPIYEYQCTNCGERFELLQRFDDPPVAVCKHCHGKAKRVISLANFHLKGSGWYATDYKNKDREKKEKKEEKESKKGD
ncbi:MAG: zinc ribbon domain-containing protein [Deltaproteobacteria bacterium]|nr:MAG: zinc ribbon domain-containing protein [Deltaproteobacteria bacterium]